MERGLISPCGVEGGPPSPGPYPFFKLPMSLPVPSPLPAPLPLSVYIVSWAWGLTGKGVGSHLQTTTSRGTRPDETTRTSGRASTG